MKAGDVCPICNSGELHPDYIIEKFLYKGSTIHISDYKIFRCDNCKEEYTPTETMEMTGPIIKAFCKYVEYVKKCTK